MGRKANFSIITILLLLFYFRGINKKANKRKEDKQNHIHHEEIVDHVIQDTMSTMCFCISVSYALAM